MLVVFGAMAETQDTVGDQHHVDGCGSPQCTPEPISMIGLGIAGLGLLRARAKKDA